jgi:hypothetical protein
MAAATEHGVRRVAGDPELLEQLRVHLLHAHRRLSHELSGLPLDAVHELEHFDAAVGLLQLDHTHLDSMTVVG